MSQEVSPERVVPALEGPAVEVVTRGRCGQREAETDRLMLWWIGRFRFVTSAELSLRFGVSEQRINARVRRFVREDLVAVHREHVSQSRAIYLTSRGASVIDQPRRKPPRADTQRRHELAIARLVAEFELHPSAVTARVYTERECRQAEAAGDRRWSVDVLAEGRTQRRWPDLVIDFGDRRQAIELELAVKHTVRLRAIIESYQFAYEFDELLWLVEQPALHRRLSLMLRDAAPRLAATSPARLGMKPVRQRVAQWAAPDANPSHRA